MTEVVICVILLVVVLGAKWILSIKINTWIGNARHGRTRAEYMSSARNDNSESFAIFTSKGRKILELSNFNTEVAVDKCMVSYCRMFRNIVSIHNHPNGHSSFSLGDIMVFRRMRLEEGIIVSLSADYYVRPRNGWGEKDAIINAFLKYTDKMELLNPEAKREDWVYNNTHEAMQLIADELNYEYRREELD